MKKATATSIIFLVLSMLVSVSSFAANGDMFAVPNNDKAVSDFLNPLFGELVAATSGVSGGSDPFSEVFKIFNEAVLFFGGILLAYGILAGTMQTAHDGEMLGRRWSSMWVPLRTSIGTSMIIPVGKGYCAIQYLIMWLVMQGVGVADTLWLTFANNQTTQENIVMASGVDGLDQLVKTVLLQRICVYSFNGTQSDSPDGQAGGTVSLVSERTESSMVLGLGNADVHKFGTSDVKDICGSISFVQRANTSDSVTTNASNALSSYWKSDMDLSPIRAAHATAFVQLMNALDPIAYAAVKGEAPPAVSIDQAVSNYKKYVVDQAINLGGFSAQIDQMHENMKKDGWLLAGAWYMKSVNLSNAIADAVSSVPKTIPPSPQRMDPSYKEIFFNNKARLVGYLGSGAFSSSGIADQVAADETQAIDEGGFFLRLSEKFFGENGGLLDWFINNGGDGQKNPVIVASAFGNKLINMTLAGITALGLLAGAAGAVRATPLGGGFASFMQSFGFLISSIVMLPLGFGITLAYYIPMLPFIMWFGGIIGWLVLVVEAVIAAPLWAVMHVHPDGDGFAGRGGQGYTLVMSLIVRPALMILGLIVAMVLMLPLGGLLNKIFLPAFKMSQGATSLGFFATVTGIGIYTTLMVGMITKVFSLIHIVPDKILSWMNGHGASLGGDISGEMAGKVAGGAALGSAVLQHGQDKASAAVNAGNQLSQLRKNNDDARKADARQSAQQQQQIAAQQKEALLNRSETDASKGTGFYEANSAAMERFMELQGGTGQFASALASASPQTQGTMIEALRDQSFNSGNGNAYGAESVRSAIESAGFTGAFNDAARSAYSEFSERNPSSNYSVPPHLQEPVQALNAIDKDGAQSGVNYEKWGKSQERASDFSEKALNIAKSVDPKGHGTKKQIEAIQQWAASGYGSFDVAAFNSAYTNDQVVRNPVANDNAAPQKNVEDME